MRLKSLVRRIPPIARRDAQLVELRRQNRALQREVSRLGGRVPKAGNPAPDDTDYGRLADQVALVRASGLFDEAWYREQVPDAADPLTHYLTTGHREGRSPHPCFDADWYVGQPRTPDTLRGPALVHYLRAGAADRVSPHPGFRADHYAKEHPESLRHPGGPLGHFLAGHEAPPAAVHNLAHLTSPATFLAAARKTSRSILATRGYEHLPRERPDHDAEAERALKAELRQVPLGDEPLVSVVLPTKDRAAVLPDAVRSVLAQTYRRWELIVVDDGSRDETPEVLARFTDDPRVRVVTHETNRGVAAARNSGLAAATGEYVAYLDSDNTWEPDFLELMVRFVRRGGHRVAYAMSALEEQGGQGRRRYRGMPYSREALLERNYIDCIVVLHERALLTEVGGFDESLRRNVDWDFLIRLSAVTDFAYAPFIATRYDLWETGTDRITTDELASYRYLIRQRSLVDWERARQEPREEGLTSVVLVANSDVATVVGTVRRLLRTATGRVEVLVVDSRLEAGEATRLQLTLWSEPRARVLRLSQELPMEVARNVGACATRGESLVFLPDALSPEPGWDAPLVAALTEYGAVQPLVLRRDGTVWSAGVMRTRDGFAVPLHAGLPGDAPEVRATRAVPGAAALALAVRASDHLAVAGFDPLVVQDHLGPELSLRLAAHTGRPSGVVGQSVVALMTDDLPTTRGSKWVSTADNEHRLAQLWTTAPEPDLAGFAIAGFTRGPDERLRALLVHERRERPLRWAIKIGAPDAPRRGRWGDWHFAVALRDSLERLGHEVTIDCRDAWYRDTAHLDDVTLVLRGRGPYRVNPAHVNVIWVISHPDEVTVSELREYDAVFGASPRWCERVSRRLDEPAAPLLQCTDHRRFRPGPPDPDRAHEVLAVANARGVRPAVAAALEGGIVPAVYGYRWKGLLPPGAWKGENIPNDELPAVYRAAGVVLNDHWEDMRRDGLLSNRLFDLAACEARMVSDHLPEIAEVFGDAVPTYRDPAELPDLVREVLADTPERQEARRRLGELVRREHTFDARARQISERVTALVRQEQPA
ncbi:glycosyltransferase [uncultured Georgenia sp.]|uniref:glycosyltransferase n=1 Tax=uncultured Georgenia sp. TaxID=378209 RepID=UPI00260B442A|nr:glycosyltransferase [uncultured Georgenia sp.]HLV05620.1 glycosyltransferase [Actinomycetaceae bacterium]